MRIERYDDEAALATGVASLLLTRLAAVQAEGRVPSVCLTGGTIADAIHAEVARLTPATGVDWARVDLWWGDERYVPADSPDRNALSARAALLDHVAVSPARVHELPADDGTRIEEAAAAYADELREHGGDTFDIVMLGVGPDGHVASLFPHSPLLEVTDRPVVAVTDSPKPPPRRLTLTLAALRRTRSAWFVVAGSGKAEAVARALAGADLHDVPAVGVTAAETLWLLDSAAAAQLP